MLLQAGEAELVPRIGHAEIDEFTVLSRTWTKTS
jgi:hypothetical protein